MVRFLLNQRMEGAIVAVRRVQVAAVLDHQREASPPAEASGVDHVSGGDRAARRELFPERLEILGAHGGSHLPGGRLLRVPAC